MAKVSLDLLLTLTVLRRVFAERYDAIHAHEEGGAIGAAIAGVLRVPHLYDMHSSLPQQLTNFAFSGSRMLRELFGTIERFMVRRSRVVIVVCPSLEDTVRAIDPHARCLLIENAPGSVDDGATPAQAAEMRQALGVGADTPLVGYTGTFEAYQGLDMLFAAMPLVVRARPEARLALAGGKPDQIRVARGQADSAGVSEAVIFAGERPASEIPAFLAASDVLVSPRSRGTNTPLKIYQYLRAGKPIVATRLLTHTQVLSDSTSILTEPTPQHFAAGIVAALTDENRAAEVATNARELATTKYSYDAYLERTRKAYAALLAPVETIAVAGAAAQEEKQR